MHQQSQVGVCGLWLGREYQERLWAGSEGQEHILPHSALGMLCIQLLSANSHDLPPFLQV